jgi:hypothetical protein
MNLTLIIITKYLLVHLECLSFFLLLTANRLDAQLEVLPKRKRYTKHKIIRNT